MNVIIEVTIMGDGKSAKDRRGNSYKIASISLGVGSKKSNVKYERYFLKSGGEHRAEVLTDGRLNIIQ
jgi:hypothetical protein